MSVRGMATTAAVLDCAWSQAPPATSSPATKPCRRWMCMGATSSPLPPASSRRLPVNAGVFLSRLSCTAAVVRGTVCPVMPAILTTCFAWTAAFARARGDEQRRLRAHGAAVLLVAGALAGQSMFGLAQQRDPFALLQAAVAGAAFCGGLASA